MIFDKCKLCNISHFFRIEYQDTFNKIKFGNIRPTTINKRFSKFSDLNLKKKQELRAHMALVTTPEEPRAHMV